MCLSPMSLAYDGPQPQARRQPASSLDPACSEAASWQGGEETGGRDNRDRLAVLPRSTYSRIRKNGHAPDHHK